MTTLMALQTLALQRSFRSEKGVFANESATSANDAPACSSLLTDSDSEMEEVI